MLHLRYSCYAPGDIKKERKSTYNSTNMNYKTGDQVFLRNYKKKLRFDPYYLPEKFVTMEVLAKGHFLLVKSLNTDKYLMRHPNDAKIFKGDIPDRNAIPDNSDINNGWKKAFEFISKNDHVHYDDSQQNCYATKDNQTDKPNPRYYNNDNDFIT